MHVLEKKPLALVLLLLLSFAAYAPSLRNEFVWDDIEVVQKSHFWFKAEGILPHLFPKEAIHKRARYWRPMVVGLYVADLAAWGTSPFGFHLTNALLNSLAVAAFWFMAIVMMGDLRVKRAGQVAFFASLLFALHPMHVESVAWVSARTDVLAALFFFLAMGFHVMNSKRGAYGFLPYLFVGALCYYLSLMSKEVAIAFPLVALFYDLLTRRVVTGRALASYVLYAALTLVYLYFRSRLFVMVPDLSAVSASGGGAALGATIGAAARLMETAKTLLEAYLFYIRKLVFPFEFNAFIAAVPKGGLYLAASCLGVLSLVVAGAASIWRRENVTAFCIFLTLATLSPSALIAVFGIASTPLAERYLYLPSAGYCLLLAYLIFKVSAGWGALSSPENVKIPSLVLLLISALYLSFSLVGQQTWVTNLALWEHTSEKTPDYALPHVNYGYALKEKGRTEEAISQFLFALSPRVHDSERGRAITANNLGTAYLDAGDYRKAELSFIKAGEYDPGYWRTYYHLGLIAYIKGQETGSARFYREAEESLLKAVVRYRYYSKAHLLLAKVYLEMGEGERARAQAEKALASGLVEPLRKEAQKIVEVYDKGGYHDPKKDARE